MDWRIILHQEDAARFLSGNAETLSLLCMFTNSLIESALEGKFDARQQLRPGD
jgi:hypothetical protein